MTATTTRLGLALAVLLLGCEGTIEGRGERAGADGTGVWQAHLLTADEYNATMRDLLGTTSRPADFFPAVSATEFDANVGVLGQLSAVQAEAMFEAARQLTDEVFASDALRRRIDTCTPTSASDEACPRASLEAFARRAFRRSPDADELDALVTSYGKARTELGLAHADALALTVRVILSHPAVFLRVERPTPVGTPEPAALASRYSYLVWGTMPDEALLEAAERGDLSDETSRQQTLTRLLSDDRGQRFVQRFLGQWLGFARLSSHHVDPAVFPRWTDAVAAGASRQAEAFLDQFVTGGLEWSQVLKAPHPTQAALQPLLRDDPQGVRLGVLTLPAYLALSSHGDRTSPTARAKGVLTGLFCTDLTPPPGVSTEFEPTPMGMAPKTTRARLEEHRRNPACASCHAMLDPVGLSLEKFDPIGAWRVTEGTEPIDASGDYFGTRFDDHRGLLPALETDSRLGPCASRKLLTFALRRSLTEADDARVARVAASWRAGSLAQLLSLVVATPEFSASTEVKR